METYLIELTDSKAYRLLQDMEDLKIIKVLKKGQQKQKIRKRSIAKFTGQLKLSNETMLSLITI